MTEFVLSFVKIAASVAMLGGVLFIMARATRAPAELRRKLIHVCLGLYCLTFPLIFAHAWEVAVACASAIGVFVLARGRLRATLGAGLHGVKRNSIGEIYFALSVALLFALYHAAAPPALGAAAYVVPVAVLTISDAAAALAGMRYGRSRFSIGEATKSWEGVAAFAGTAWLVSLSGLTALTELGALEVFCLALCIAVSGAALEAVCARGLDNLLVPIGAYVVLATVTGGSFDWVAMSGLAGAAALTLVWCAAPGYAVRS